MNNNDTKQMLINCLLELVTEYQTRIEEYEWKKDRASDTKKTFTEYDLRREQEVLTNSFLYDLSVIKNMLEENL